MNTNDHHRALPLAAVTVLAFSVFTLKAATAQASGAWQSSAALTLDLLGQRAAHDAIVAAIEQGLFDGPRIADLGVRASTTEIGQASAAALSR